jgi:PAS domain S-box-containing protein
VDQFQDQSEGTKELTKRIRELENRVAELEMEGRRLRLMLDSANDAIFVHGYTENGLPGKFFEVNKTAQTRLGYSREDLLDMSPADIDKQDPTRDLPAMIAEMIPVGERVFTVDHVTRDGREIPTEINTKLFDLDGKMAAISVARDISERLESRLELENKTRELNRRIKEIDLFRDIADLVSQKDVQLEDVLQGIANLLPQTAYNPQGVCVSVSVGDRSYFSGSLETCRKLFELDLKAGDEIVGKLVFGRSANGKSATTIDLEEEEKKLIELVAERIGRIIQRYRLLDDVEADQRQKIMEIARLEGMVGEVSVPVSLSWYGSGSLRDSASGEFEHCVDQFAQLLDKILEEQAFKRNNEVSEQIRSMAESLGFMKAGPRDVIQIYLTALKKMAASANRSRLSAYSEWGRILALELMGYLVSYYKRRAGGFRFLGETKGESQE